MSIKREIGRYPNVYPISTSKFQQSDWMAKKHENVINMSLLPFGLGGYSYIYMHRLLLEDRLRTASFQEAISRVVKRGDVVVDLGSGSGILSYFASKAGAKTIYAIEVENITEIASEISAKNRMSRKIKFIKNLSSFVTLPEKVDVLISECINWFVIGGNMVPAVIDIRDKFLNKGGKIIPQGFTLKLAPVQSNLHYNYINSWKHKKWYDVDFSPLQKYTTNNVFLTTMGSENLMSEPQELTSFSLLGDYPPTHDSLNTKLEFSIINEGILHGLLGWFDIDLCNDLTLSTSPEYPTTVWQQVFFPLEKEIELQKGNKIIVEFSYKSKIPKIGFIFNWGVEVTLPNGRREQVKQSTLKSYPLSFQKKFKSLFS